MNDLRKVERKHNNSWVQCRMSDLKKGDLFRMSESDGESLGEWIVEENPRLGHDAANADDVWGVVAHPS